MIALGSTLMEHSSIGPDGVKACREFAEAILAESGEDPDAEVKVQVQIVGGMP